AHGEEDAVGDAGGEALLVVVVTDVAVELDAVERGVPRGGDGDVGEAQDAGALDVDAVGGVVAEVRLEVRRVGHRAEDLAEEDEIDLVVEVEAEVADRGVERALREVVRLVDVDPAGGVAVLVEVLPLVPGGEPGFEAEVEIVAGEEVVDL